jgi:GDP-L-fucose synthase
MKVVLTGGRGLVGQAIRAAAKDLPYEIIAPTSADLDLTDRAAVFAAIASEKPDLVIHAAGYVGGISANMSEPARYLVDNMDMGFNVVLAAQAAGVKRLINLGSSCMYPRDAPNPLQEESFLKGELEPTNEGYAIAKVAVMRLCSYLSEAGSVQYKTLVPCNLFGPYDKFDPARSHLLPAIIKKIHDAKASNAPTVEIWGDGTARREFMYSGDLADGIWFAVENFDAVPTVMNIGPGFDHSINHFYEEAARVLGWEGEFTHDLSRPVGMKRKLMDISKQTELGWKPKTPLAESLLATYKYYVETPEAERK